MNRTVLGVILLLVAGVGVGLWVVRARAGDGALVLSGTVEARDVQVGSLVGGRVAAVHVEEGSAVAPGQPLVSLETDLLDLQIRQQQGRVAETRANLAKVLAGPRREEVERAKAEADNAERERQRFEKLLAEGVIGAQQYDAAATRAKTTLEAYRQLQVGSRVEEIAAARAAVEREQGQLAYLERQRQETEVKSPAAGVIESMDLRPGDLVGPNQPVATILEPDQVWVRVYVPEPKLGLVKIGQAAAISVDTFPGRAFPGRVVEVRNRGEYTPRNLQTVDQRQEQVFGIKVLIDPTPELRPGMAALVRMEP